MPHDWRTLSIGIILLTIVAPLSVSFSRRIVTGKADLIGIIVFGVVLLCGFVFGVQLTLDGSMGKKLTIAIKLVESNR